MAQIKVSKKQQQAERRTRLDALRQQQRRKERRSTMLVIGSSVTVGLLLLGLVGFSIANRHHAHPVKLGDFSIAPARPTTATGRGTTVPQFAVDSSLTSPIPGVVFYSGVTFGHVTGPITYGNVPPVGGPHNPVWLNCGVYDQPVPSENAVHDMEHGAVWITYQPGLAASQVNVLKKIVQSYGGPYSYVDLSPFPGLSSPVVLSAWGVQLKVAAATDARVKAFVKNYREGPQTRERGSSCGPDGTGSPEGTVNAAGTPPGSGLTPVPNSTGPTSTP